IGERQDDETALVFLHARYYDPAWGLFLSPDPVSPALPGVGTNRYAYGLNNPISWTDRSGLISDSDTCSTTATGGESQGPNGTPSFDMDVGCASPNGGTSLPGDPPGLYRSPRAGFMPERPRDEKDPKEKPSKPSDGEKTDPNKDCTWTPGCQSP